MSSRNQLSLLGVAAVIMLSHAAAAQTRLSVGVGGGMAGSTDASLSEGHAAPVVMGQATMSLVPLVGAGVEVDDWRRSGSNIVFGAAHLQLHVPVVPLYLKFGVGYGSGDPDGRGRVSGTAIQIGGAYDLTLPLAPVALTVFGNAFLSHSTARSMQMVDAGLAFTWR
jgi:hypothetical protein